MLIIIFATVMWAGTKLNLPEVEICRENAKASIYFDEMSLKVSSGHLKGGEKGVAAPEYFGKK